MISHIGDQVIGFLRSEYGVKASISPENDVIMEEPIKDWPPLGTISFSLNNFIDTTPQGFYIENKDILARIKGDTSFQVHDRRGKAYISFVPERGPVWSQLGTVDNPAEKLKYYLNLMEWKLKAIDKKLKGGH